MQTSVERAQQRALQYGYNDGLIELSSGIITLLLGAYLWLQATLPEEDFTFKLLNAASVFVFFALTFLSWRLREFLKRRITYPRTGFVAYRRTGWKIQWLSLLIAALIIAVGVGLLAIQPHWMPAVGGIVFAVALLAVAVQFRLNRFYLLSLATLLFGASLAVIGPGDVPGLAYFFILTGLLFSGSGGMALRRYIHQNPTPAEAADEG